MRLLVVIEVFDVRSVVLGDQNATRELTFRFAFRGLL